VSAPAEAARPGPSAGGENPHRAVRVLKAVVNVGVGESGEPLAKASKVLQMVTGQKPIQTRSHSTNRDFGIRKGQAIGAKVTLRGPAAVQFLTRAFDARDKQLDGESIDRNGNFSFGVADYTDFAGMKYDPAIGIHGMDVAVELGRAGYRVRNRRSQQRPVPKRLRSTSEETREFLRRTFQLTIIE
jgi:large subunit ribosomal protein L5